jgi:4-amino-4-deoxy-L-arabinose transferase-like glycosyltransferase
MRDLLREPPVAATAAEPGFRRRLRAAAVGLEARAAALALGAMILLSTALRGWAASRVPTPWIQPDETVYAELGRSLWSSGHLEVLGRHTAFYSAVYPALVGGPLGLADREVGFSVLQWLQALVVSLAAVPVYLWGRSLVSQRRWALAAAALTLLLPGLAYSGLVMSEVAFLPLLVLAAWATARALEAPTARAQVLATAA